jgi:hypothetical protein
MELQRPTSKAESGHLNNSNLVLHIQCWCQPNICLLGTIRPAAKSMNSEKGLNICQREEDEQEKVSSNKSHGSAMHKSPAFSMADDNSTKLPSITNYI